MEIDGQWTPLVLSNKHLIRGSVYPYGKSTTLITEHNMGVKSAM
jgi:hypothetical protein